MPDLPPPPVSNIVEWMAVFGFVGAAGIIFLLLTRTIPGAFSKVDALGERFEKTHKESTDRVVAALDKLGDKVEASANLR